MATDIRYCELLDFHMRHVAAAIIAMRAHEWEQTFGVMLTHSLVIVGFDEKSISRAMIRCGTTG